MTPHYADDWLTVYGGDARTVLLDLPSDSVDCIVTSPPYWGLRDYGSDGQLGLVANRLSRRAILIDLNPEYLAQQMRRNAQVPVGL